MNYKNVLIISHQLTRTGAALAALDLACCLKKTGQCQVEVVSLKEGSLRKDFESNKINVNVCESLLDDAAFIEKLCGKYDFVVVNTLQCTPIVSYMASRGEIVYWWIHENRMHFEQIDSYLRNMKFGDNVKVLSAGQYVSELVDEYIGVESMILNIQIQDWPKTIDDSHQKVRFAQVGLFDGMKGQEVLISALTKLPANIMNRIEIYFVGDTENANPQILGLITNTQRLYKNIMIMPGMNREEMSQFYDLVDCVVVPSRIESMSAVMIEGFMKRKVCICTDTTGISRYMKPDLDGFVFPVNDGEALAAIIQKIVELNDKNQLDTIRNNGRRIYEDNFTEKIFEKKVIDIFKINCQ
ncbi:MAG: glycosyltransferase family 4 protein [Lachnospiraceae bacterium]